MAPRRAAEPAGRWQPPDTSRSPAAFDEQDVTVGSDPLAGVPGALEHLPAPGLAVTAVVLLSGSGPQDHDETIGRNKQLKDLALGLTSRGVAAAAVLRFDKLTSTPPLMGGVPAVRLMPRCRLVPAAPAGAGGLRGRGPRAPGQAQGPPWWPVPGRGCSAQR